MDAHATCLWHILRRVQIWRSLAEVPPEPPRSVVVIGNFDGLHLGHRQVLAQARAAADAEGMILVVVSFDPHPLKVLRPDHAPETLSSIETRCELLEQAGADAVLVLPFTRELSTWTPDEFIDRVLIAGLNARSVVVGDNFRFGARAAGDVHTLREHGGFSVRGLPLEHHAGDERRVWSSTYIRSRLAEGDVAAAAEALGRPHTVRGPVLKGDRRGRELGFPTANVAIGEVMAPADGVYAGWLTRLDTRERFPAAISVGTNPTFDGHRDRRVEAYVLDRDDLELYGVEVEIGFVQRLRGMVRFDGMEELIQTMHDDVRRTRELLG